MSINIKGKQYVTVAERVKAIHNDKFIDGFSITTEVISHDPVVVKATVTIEEKESPTRVFTGISYANTSKTIEKMSPYEVAETSAVGRALGFAGYGLVDDIATADEMVKAGVKSDDLDIADMFSDTPKGQSGTPDISKMTFRGKPLRDTKGHTTCSKDGRVVSRKVEESSLKEFGRVLCWDCQQEERDKASA